jgi:hypothetical protein
MSSVRYELGFYIPEDSILHEDYEERDVGSSERDYGGGEQNISSVLKKKIKLP